MNRTVFISSTYKDLKDHRKQVWEALTKYDVNVRGMERFGARKEAPLETCLSEVEQSDIFIGIISHRLGTIDKNSAKSFVQCEYEKALELEKDIFIYLIDDNDGFVHPNNIDFGENHEKLNAFKSILRERHTTDTFKNSEDLTEKLSRKFDNLLTPKDEGSTKSKNEYQKTSDIFEKFLLFPNKYSGKDVKIRIKIDGDPFPASKSLCKSFYLSYGNTIGVKIKIIKPNYKGDSFDYLFISQKIAEDYFLIDKSKSFDIYATLDFSDDSVKNLRANFVSRTYFTVSYATQAIRAFESQYDDEPKKVTEPAEGQIILQLKEVLK